MIGFLTGLGSKFMGLGSIKMMIIVAAVTSVTVGSVAFIAGQRWEKADRYEEATEVFRELLERAQKGDFDLMWANIYLASIYAMRGDMQKASFKAPNEGAVWTVYS